MPSCAFHCSVFSVGCNGFTTSLSPSVWSTDELFGFHVVEYTGIPAAPQTAYRRSGRTTDATGELVRNGVG
jgi:hypothetical protein